MSRPALRRPRSRSSRLLALLLASALVVATPTALRAQAAGGAPAPAAAHRWTAVRVAKWALLGTAAAFGAYALSHSTRADRAYGDLRRLCVAVPAGCTLDGGRYVAPRAESLYGTSLREDRRAQLGIVGGQVALLGSVALFVYDLRNGRGPGNIPYPGGAARGAAPPRPGVMVGAAVGF